MTTPHEDRPSPYRTLDAMLAEYRARTPRSASAYGRTTGALPGGETRHVTFYPPYPVVLAEGHGPCLLDVDGIEYLDLVNNYTSLVHGNAYPPAVAAASAALASGAALPSPHEAQLKLAELLISRVPSLERVRFTNSGTEASALAACLTRRATGRARLLLFEGAHHGGFGAPEPGGPDIVTVPYNDLDAVHAVLTEDIAAVFAEPFLGAGGVIPGRAGFLRAVADLARSRGALFVLDEVQSLRNGLGGEQGRLGLRPDLTVLGKIIGGGLPIGAVGGTETIMRLTAATTPGALPHYGTFNGHLAAMSAGEVTLRDLHGRTIERLGATAARLADAIGAAADRAGFTVAVTRAGSILNVHFAEAAPVNAAQAGTSVRSTILRALHLALLLEGVYTTPRGMINLSTALGPGDLERVTNAYARAFHRLAPADVPAELDRSGRSRDPAGGSR